jgi:hypothetical protein
MLVMERLDGFVSPPFHPVAIAVQRVKLFDLFLPHRSLYELIHNDALDLDVDVKMAFVKDLVHGMVFLHSCKPAVLHGV